MAFCAAFKNANLFGFSVDVCVAVDKAFCKTTRTFTNAIDVRNDNIHADSGLMIEEMFREFTCHPFG